MRKLPIAPEIVEDLDNEVSELRQQVIRLECQLAFARKALEQYALRSNWQRSARFDPNAPWFDGISFAQDALEKTNCRT